MANLFDYIKWRGDIDFDQSPFNPVDNIIFAQLSYLPMDGIVPGPGGKNSISITEAAARCAERHYNDPAFAGDDLNIRDAVSVIGAMGASPRYRNCELWCYTSLIDLSQEKQFSAFCAAAVKNRLKRDLFVVYRGTDLTLVGWKEDFNMSFKSSVPSQQEAVSYLENIAARFSGPITMIGHSKGGNLAVYAAANCREKTRRRITAVYSNDAPGFHRDVIQSDGYRSVLSRIHAFVPQSSIVGMLFEHGETPLVVKSKAGGPLQHFLSSWEVTHNGFVSAGELSQQSRLVDNIIREWLNEMESGERQEFVEAVYKILVASEARSITDLTGDWLKSAGNIINSLKNIDKPSKKLIGKITGDLFRAARKIIREQRKGKTREITP